MIGDLRRAHGQQGISIVEMTVAMALTALVAVAVVSMMSVSQRTERFTGDDSQALSSLRTSMQRLTKELRQARKVYDDSTSTSIRFWVDYDRDNQQDLAEQLTWQVELVSGGEHLTRRGGDGSLAVVSPDILASSTFVYEPALPDPTIVHVTLEGDATVGAYAEARVIETEVRLRNAPADQ